MGVSDKLTLLFLFHPQPSARGRVTSYERDEKEGRNRQRGSGGPAGTASAGITDMLEFQLKVKVDLVKLLKACLPLLILLTQ